jgi:hypothetical protein
MRDKLLDVCCGHPGGVASSDQRSHAGPRDAIDGNVQLLEDLQYSDVGTTPCPAARERQSDARTPVSG